MLLSDTVLLPIESAYPPCINESGEQDHKEKKHLDKTENTQASEDRGPRVQKGYFKIEYNEEQCQEKKSDGYALGFCVDVGDPAFIRGQLFRTPLAPPFNLPESLTTANRYSS